MSLRLIALTAFAATAAVAKTDIAGCTYVDGVASYSGRPDIPPFATRTWYVPDTGEICEILDCGGGRAPPKTDVPGCGNYKGTDTYSPRYMPSTTAAEAEPTEDAEASGSQELTTLLTTASPTKSEDAPESTETDEDEDDEEAETSASETEKAEASETDDAEATETDDAEASETDDAEATETDEEEVNASSTDDEGAEETGGIPESGAAAMGVSVSGLVAAAVALGMF